MSWLIVEIWRAIQDAWRARQEEKWRDELIELNTAKKISGIRAGAAKSKAKLVDALVELQEVRAGYIRSTIPTEEDRDNGNSGISEESKRKTKTSKHS